ncbi:MAG: PfkB family carbohydrate kinase [Geminicoccaceae bacterium]
MYDVCLIGHVVRDLNSIGGADLPPRPGGAAYYATMVYRRLGLRTAVVTRVAAPDEDLLLSELRTAGVEVINLPIGHSTTFRNIYLPDDVRIQRVDQVAAPIALSDIPELDARIWQLGPLTDRDLDPLILARGAPPGSALAIDVQGLTRTLVDGEVRPAAPAASLEHLRNVEVLKADDGEILTHTGARSVDAAASRVRAAGVREALITLASRGAMIYAGGPRLDIAAVPPRRKVDLTGCGDTFLAAYMARRLGSDDVRECAEFAAVAAAINIESYGAFQGSLEEIAARRAARA